MKHDEQEAGMWRTVAWGLGWFSIGLGVAEMVAPRMFSKAVGIARPKPGLTASMGAREVAAGIGILSSEMPVSWMWARVAGDGLDLAALAMALATRRNGRGRLLAATAAVLGVTAADVVCARRLSGQARPTHVMQAVTINRPAADLYEFWSNQENLRGLMPHIREIARRADGRSHRVAQAPGGVEVEWESEVTEASAPHRFAWRALPGSAITHAGAIYFRPAPGNRGTEVRLEMDYQLPGNGLGRSLAMVFGAAPEQEVAEALRRFKQVMETGEVAQAEGQAQGGQLIPPSAQPHLQKAA